MNDKNTPESDAKNETKNTETGKEKQKLEKEINGYESQGLKEPTRYGDWEVKGRCSDF